MSNVLIGIIGVTLFIGLALAGALFLGTRFQEATINSKASAQVQAMQQIASAANLYQLREGSFQNDVSVLVDQGYLKTRPADASGVGANFIIATFDGAPHVLIGGQSRKVCEAVNRQMLGSGVATPNTHDAKVPVYCYGSGAENEFFLTARV